MRPARFGNPVKGVLAVAGVLALAGALLTWPAAANEMVVEGEVLEVVPLQRAEMAPCEVARPPADAGLAALLRWDLGLGCEPARHSRVSRYQVTYRWDDRVHTRVLDYHPGDRIALKVRIH